MSFHVPERYRMVDGPLASDATYGNNGAFVIPSPISGRLLVMIASDGLGWEHVSVRAVRDRQNRTPVWDEMAFAKGVFWDEEDTVVQFHPPRSEYVNNHANVLHLWRSTEAPIRTPDMILVGFKEMGVISR